MSINGLPDPPGKSALSRESVYRSHGLWSEKTVLGRFSEFLSSDPEKTAVKDDRGVCLNRSELWNEGAEIAAEFGGHGLSSGDVVLICLPNRVEWQTVFVGCLRQNLIPASLPVTTDPASIAYVYGLIGAKAVVLPQSHRSRDFSQEIKEIAAQTGARLNALLIDNEPGQRRWLTFDGPQAAPVPLPDGAAHILFTSSTTGKPKGAVHTDHSLGAFNASFVTRFGISEDQPIFMPSPMGHSTGAWHGARLSMYTGAPLVLQDRWDPHRALELVEQEECGFTAAATPFLKDLVDVAWDGAKPKLSSMHTFLCGGAPVPPALLHAAHEQMPNTFISVLWGMSEGGGSTSMVGDSVETIANTAGVGLPCAELETIDSRGNINPRGVVGEVVLRGPAVFVGYVGQGDLYRDSLVGDGYLRTGDLGVVDEKGYLTLTGRLKDIIIRGGVNISPLETENALLKHEGIDRVAVVGIPDERLGERICAVVLPKGEPPALDELLEWADKEGLPRTKWPEHLRIVSSMPVTAAGKIRKNVLREQIVQELK